MEAREGEIAEEVELRKLAEVKAKADASIQKPGYSEI